MQPFAHIPLASISSSHKTILLVYAQLPAYSLRLLVTRRGSCHGCSTSPRRCSASMSKQLLKTNLRQLRWNYGTSLSCESHSSPVSHSRYSCLYSACDRIRHSVEDLLVARLPVLAIYMLRGSQSMRDLVRERSMATSILARRTRMAAKEKHM